MWPGKYIIGLLCDCFVPFWYKGMQIRFELHMTLHVKYTFDRIMGDNSAKYGTVVDRLILKEHTASLIDICNVHIMHETIPTGM